MRDYLIASVQNLIVRKTYRLKANTLLRWIGHLARLGRMSETTDRVELATVRALEERRQHPFLGGSQLYGKLALPMDAQDLYSSAVGYVQHIDIQALGRLTSGKRSAIYVHVLLGSLVDRHTTLA
ncbi:DUF2254 family protein [Paraburkholderia fungorum]|uniref:DUF2254 family protein n=1 Tax=Paraburkholderia fungorum TaxID=134537 RepID=UPI0038BBC35A